MGSCVLSSALLMSFLVAIVVSVENLEVGERTIAGRGWCKGGFQMVAGFDIVKVLEWVGSE
jgi:hypothetical protein